MDYWTQMGEQRLSYLFRGYRNVLFGLNRLTKDCLMFSGGYRNGLLGSNGLKANVPLIEEPLIYSFILNQDSLHTRLNSYYKA